MSDPMKEEFTTLGEIGELYFNAADKISTVQAGIAGYQTQLDGFKLELEDYAETFSDFMDSYNETVEADTKLKIGRFYAWTVGIVTAIILG